MSNKAQTQGDRPIIHTSFGSVYEKQVVYFRGKGWFRGGSREDVPLKHITSVRIDITRHIIGGVVLGLIGLLALGVGELELVIFGTVLIVLAIMLIWGSPSVVINTAGGDLSEVLGFPWQRNEANAFVETLRKQLFRE